MRPTRVGQHPGAFRDGTRHAHLIDLLRRAQPQALLPRASGNVHHRRLHVIRERQPRYGVGVPGRRKQGNPRTTSHATVGVRHIHRGLLMPHVDEPKALIRHMIHERQRMIARDRKQSPAAHGLESPGDDLVSLQIHADLLQMGLRSSIAADAGKIQSKKRSEDY